MNDFVLSCSSTADLSQEEFDARGIQYICFHYSIDGVQMNDDLGKTMPFDTFYQRMMDGAETSTSQINADEYYEYWEGFLEDGKDVLHVTLSSGVSGSYNSAVIARDMLKEKYPDRTVRVVDGLAASSGYGLLMDKLADLRDAGKTVDETADWAEEHKLEVQHWFFSTDLTFFIKGGRISKTAGFVGTLMKICPLMNVDNNGKLVPRAKVRSKHKVIKEIVDRMIDNAQDGLNYSGKCFLSHSYCLEDAKAVAELVKASFTKLNGEPVIHDIGTTIGSHTGPGTVALFFWGKKRVD
ncbi:MAG TPA: DegV family protein [Candidatus Limiplasma sp.]|nr:DegV family protein [Candidatus Limiplasma sp.]